MSSICPEDVFREKFFHDISPLVCILQNFFKFGNCCPKFRRVVLDKLGIQIGLIADSGILAAKICDHMAIFPALNFNINKTYTVTDKISMKSFTGRNIDSFTNELEDINWHQDFDHNSTADPLISYDNKCSTKPEQSVPIERCKV